MDQLYIPYVGNRPATVDINGHRIVILASEKEQLEEHLDLLGGDHVFSVQGDDFASEEDLLNGVSAATNATVVLTPENLDVAEVIQNLKESLPWTQ